VEAGAYLAGSSERSPEEISCLAMSPWRMMSLLQATPAAAPVKGALSDVTDEWRRTCSSMHTPKRVEWGVSTRDGVQLPQALMVPAVQRALQSGWQAHTVNIRCRKRVGSDEEAAALVGMAWLRWIGQGRAVEARAGGWHSTPAFQVKPGIAYTVCCYRVRIHRHVHYRVTAALHA
jgi:hypothetical protein